MCKAEVRGACSRQGLVVGSVERAFGSHPKSESRPVADLDNNSEHFTSTRLIFLQIDVSLHVKQKPVSKYSNAFKARHSGATPKEGTETLLLECRLRKPTPQTAIH